MLPIFLSGRAAGPLVLGLLSALPVLPVACQGTVGINLRADFPGFSGEVGFEGEWPNRTMSVSSSRSFSCVQIQFTDANGNPVGEPWTGSVPAQDIPVPQGGADFEMKECEEEEERVLAGPRGKLRYVREWFFMGGPIEPRPLAGEMSYAVSISAVTQDRAEDLLEELLTEARQGPAGLEALPAGLFRIHYLARGRLVDVNMVFEFFDDAPFERLDFTLNGVPEVRTVDDAATIEAGGWHAAVLTVPVTEFEIGAAPGTIYHNDFVFDLLSGSVPCAVSGFCDYTLH